MTIFSQDDPFYLRVGKAALFVATTVLALVFGFLLVGLFMVVIADGPKWFFDALVFLVLEPISKGLQFLYSLIV